MSINFYNRVGKMSIKRKRNVNGDVVENVFDVSIWDGNCLAVFNTEDEEKYYLFDFLQDAKHANNRIKENGSLFGEDVQSIELNTYYQSTRQMLKVFTKAGYKVTC